MTWMDEVPIDPEKKLTREEVERIWKRGFHVKPPLIPCVVCGKDSEYLSPPKSTYCKLHVPEFVTIMPWEEYVKRRDAGEFS